MTTKRLDALWRTYSELLPVSASTTQHMETRRAFYAGAASLFSTIMQMLDPGTEPTDADLKKMDELVGELQQFSKDLGEGRA